jgi:hypothetical protein
MTRLRDHIHYCNVANRIVLLSIEHESAEGRRFQCCPFRRVCFRPKADVDADPLTQHHEL